MACEVQLGGGGGGGGGTLASRPRKLDPGQLVWLHLLMFTLLCGAVPEDTPDDSFRKCCVVGSS